MDKIKKLEGEIGELEEQRKDREASLPAHSVRPEQMLAIEELEIAIMEKKSELDELRKKKPNAPVD